MPGACSLQHKNSYLLRNIRIHDQNKILEFCVSNYDHTHIRDLARTHLACLLDRQFPKKLLFGQAQFYKEFSNFVFRGIITKYFPKKHNIQMSDNQSVSIYGLQV